MKKTLVFLLTLAMIMSAMTGLASAKDVAPYYGFSTISNGQVEPEKHDLIQAGEAGGEEDDYAFEILAAAEGAVPTIDGVCSPEEGYADFVNWEDYLYIICMTSDEETFDNWYNWVAGWDLKVKSCWDGTYLYMYFEYSVKDYKCEVTSGASLWQWECIQMGLANADAMGTDRSETGYGISSTTMEPYTANWGGAYAPMDGVDYIGTLDMETTPGLAYVTHEFRVNLKQALGRENPVETGEQIRMAWVIMANNDTAAPSTSVSFGHGITGMESYKAAQHFVLVTLSGDVKPVEEDENKSCYTPTEDDLDCGFDATSSIFFEDIVEINDFLSKENCSGTYVGDEDVKFERIETAADYAMYYSAKRFPRALSKAYANIDYAVVRYRTNDVTTLDLNFIGSSTPIEPGASDDAFDPEEAISPMEDTPIVADGQWRYAIFDLTEYSYWEGVINKLAFCLSRGTIDIESIRFFTDDPFDVYAPLNPIDPNAPAKTEAPTAAPTEAPTAAVTEAPTAAADGSEAATEAGSEVGTDTVEETGCASVLTGSALVLTAIAAAVALKKKH